MDMRERHFGPIATLTSDGKDVTTDVSTLVRRLLLFEHCYLESSQLREIPDMIRAFGFDGVMRLLDDPNFTIICDAITAGSVGRLAGLNLTLERGPLPLGSYHIAHIALSTKNGLHDALANVHKSEGVSLKQIQRLKLKLVDKITKYPDEAGRAGIDDYAKDLENGSPSLPLIIKSVVNRDLRLDVGDRLTIDINKLPHEGDYSVHTNLASDFGVEDALADKTVERALLGVAGLNQRLQLMKSFNAVTGFQDAEAPFYESKLAFIFKEIDPTEQEKRFQRVEQLGELPNIHAGQQVNIQRLLDLRDDPECIALRRWFRTTDGQRDQTIQDQFNSVKEKLASITHSRTGKVIRFIATNGLGAVPNVGIVLGPAASLADQYIADHLIGLPGPVCFLSHQYTSIFSNQPHQDKH